MGRIGGKGWALVGVVGTLLGLVGDGVWGEGGKKAKTGHLTIIRYKSCFIERDAISCIQI